MTHRFHPSILREYDIRGVVGETLGPDDAHALGRCFAAVVRASGGGKVAVGRDGRLSSPMLEAALVAGLVSGGVDVVRIGLVPTPVLYFAEASAQDVDGGIQVTGSHNPKDHNGFKMVHQGRPFFGDEIARLGRMAAREAFTERLVEAGEVAIGAASRQEGRIEDRDVSEAWVDSVLGALDGVAMASLAPLRIGWDAGNGAAGPLLERLLARLPGEHHVLFSTVDGHFPNHHPDPTVEANLADLKALVAAQSLHFGIAFDGDADRIVVVDAKGRPIWGDTLLLILARDVLRDLPGAQVIADVKASRVLFDGVAALGGKPLMWKTGHSLIKAKMKATGAPLGGEMTGHVFFADRYYGYDDAIYAALRLIAASIRLGLSVTEMHDAVPPTVSTPELRFQAGEGRKFAAVEEVRTRLRAAGADLCEIDGVRVTTADGWWLLRASNTQDVLTARAEGDSEAGLARLVAQIDAQLALSGLSRGPQVPH